MACYDHIIFKAHKDGFLNVLINYTSKEIQTNHVMKKAKAQFTFSKKKMDVKESKLEKSDQSQ